MKRSLLLIGLLLAAGFSTVASAHSYLGTLGSATTATDKWYFQCISRNTVKVTFQVRRTAGTPCVRAIYNATGQNGTSCGALAPATPITVATGAGAKFFTINKNSTVKTGTNSYAVVAHCWNRDGTHVDSQQTTPQVYQQNQ